MIYIYIKVCINVPSVTQHIPHYNKNVIYMNIFIIMLNCLQSDPFKLETGGMVDMKELKKKYKKNSVYLDIP